jgi:hypothetical protein
MPLSAANPQYSIFGGLYITFKPIKEKSGTAIFKSEDVLGPYLPWSLSAAGVSGLVTPAGWECLDGTFFEEDEIPRMVFCHEWQQAGDGEICALQLTDDLRCAAAGQEPSLLFRASEAPWSFELKGRAPGSFVTDGPFLLKTGNGVLFLLWSCFGKEGNYCIGAARS